MTNFVAIKPLNGTKVAHQTAIVIWRIHLVNVVIRHVWLHISMKR